MRKLVSIFIIVFACTTLAAQEQTEINGCYVTRYWTYDHGSSHSFEAYGDVYVETDPSEPVDMKVRIVQKEEDATYNVFKTNSEPQNCGEWRFTNNKDKAKFTIRYVKDWEDCRVFFVKDRNKAGF